MLDREEFDRHINSITDRYRKICHPGHSDYPKSRLSPHESILKDINQNDIYTTPIRSFKYDEYD